MTSEAKVTAYRNGAFCEEPAPDWYREADELSAGGLDWYTALSRVLGTDYSQYAESLGDVGIDIYVWRSATLGAFVETGDCIRTWDAVWVPSSSDWWPFQAQYLLPLVASASNIAIAERLNRIGNVMIAYVRHGEGSSIDEDTGRSLIDIRREQERQRSYRTKS